MEITPKTKVHDLLETYPQLEAFLMRLNPKYKKLKNPVLRRTVARIATLAQVAKIGGYTTTDLVNRLRREVGQPLLNETGIDTEETITEAPEWITAEPAMVIDASALLEKERNPLAEVTAALKSICEEDVILLKSDFLPAPLIDTLKEKGYEVYSSESSNGEYFTYIKKKK